MPGSRIGRGDTFEHRERLTETHLSAPLTLQCRRACACLRSVRVDRVSPAGLRIVVVSVMGAGSGLPLEATVIHL